MKRLASITSWVFHPLWIPPIAIFGFIEIDPYLHAFFPRDFRIHLLLLLLLNTVIAPAMSVVFLKRARMIQSIRFEERSQRFWLYGVAIFYYGITYFLWRTLPIPNEIKSIFLGIILSMFVALVVNSRIKISAHTLSMAGILGTLLALFIKHEFFSLIYLELALFLTGWVMSSRLILKAHTLKEVIYGFVLGVGIMFGTVYFSLQL